MSKKNEYGYVKSDYVYAISTLWGPRPECLEATTRKWISLIRLLRSIDSLFDKWEYYDEDRGIVPYVPDFDVQMARARSEMELDTSGMPVDALGTHLWLSNGINNPQNKLQMDVRAGVDYLQDRNSASFSTSQLEEASPRLLEYRIMRAVLLAAAETFDVTHGLVWPMAIRGLWSEPSGLSDTLDLAWMSYVGPRHAHLVTPPPTVISEIRPDGGLFMAATADIFAMDNPVHLGAAGLVRDALAAYNAVPWTTETGK